MRYNDIILESGYSLTTYKHGSVDKHKYFDCKLKAMILHLICIHTCIIYICFINSWQRGFICILVPTLQRARKYMTPINTMKLTARSCNYSNDRIFINILRFFISQAKDKESINYVICRVFLHEKEACDYNL